MEEKRQRGRPPKPDAERGAKYNAYLPVDVAEWLKAQPEGFSPTIARLVRKEISKTKKGASKSEAPKQ